MSYPFSSKLVNVQLLLGVALVVLIMIIGTTPTALAEHHDLHQQQPSKVASYDDPPNGPQLPQPYPTPPYTPYPGHPPVLKNPQHKPEP
ncbi:hypothetical protein M0R45_018411 [Rubus argutus]|uniref:Uncharacterized protein n=1 Tax=Rubus argutus TaxID=59490 RepID=A0AAW1X463_RUBAR